MEVATKTVSLNFTSSYKSANYSRAQLGIPSAAKIIYADAQVKIMDNYTELYLETTFTEDSVSIGFRKTYTSTTDVNITVFYKI